MAIDPLEDLRNEALQVQAGADSPSPPPSLRPFAQSQPASGGAPPASTAGGATAPGRRATPLGFWDRVRQVVRPVEDFDKAAGNVVLGTDAGILRAPGQLLGSVLDTGNDIGKFIGDNIDAKQARQHPIKSALATDLLTGSDPLSVGVRSLASIGHIASGLNHGASLADTLSLRQSLGQVGNPGVNQFSAEATSILGSLVATGGAGDAPAAVEAAPAAMRILSGAGRLLLNSAKVGATTAVVADPRAARISNLIQQAGVHNAVVDYLAADPSDSGLEGRLKNGIEGALANTALEPAARALGGVAKAIGASLRKDPAAAQQALQEAAAEGLPQGTKITEATPEEAAHERIDRAMASGRTQEARYVAQEQSAAATGTDQAGSERPEPPVPQEAVPPSRHTDGGGEGEGAGGASQPAGSPEALAADANGALSKTGAAERLDPQGVAVRPDGKITVAPATKAAADEAGVGRVFAADNEAVPPNQVIFKETSPDGGQRVVGMMGKDDLQALSDEAADLRDHALDTHGPREGVSPENAGRALDVTGDHPNGQWRIGQLGASYDVPAMMRAIIERTPGAARPRSDEALMRAAQATASALGDDPENILQAAANFAGHTGDLDTAMAVHRLVWTQMARDLDDLVGKDFSQSSEAEVQDAAGKIHNMMTFTTYLEEAKTGIARALRVNALPDADAYLESLGKGQRTPTPLDRVQPGNMPPLPRTPEELKQWVDLWNATKGDPDARNLFLRGLTFTPNKWLYLRNSFANFFSASIVSGPATFMRDLAGPGVVGALRTIERTTGGLAASLNPTISAADRQELMAVATQAVPSYLQTIGDSLDALKAGIKATASGHSVLGGQGPLDLNVKGVPQPLIDAATQGKGPLSRIPYLLGNAVNLWPQAVHALHGGVNEFAARLAYLGEVRAQAMLDASQEGLKGQDFGRFVRDRLTSSTDPLSGQATNDTLLSSAQRTTFTRGTDATDPGVYQKVDGLVSWLKQNVPEFRYILPIWTVPANAIGESMRRIPGINFLLKETQQELAGERGAIQQAESYGRFLSGAGLLGAGFGMARSGMMTGAGPSNPHDRAAWLAQGNIPYAIKLGDNWVSYNRLDVVGAMLGIAASTYDHTVYHGPDQNSVFAGVGALAQFFKDQSALEGVSNLLSFGGDPQNDQHFLDRFAQQTVSGFIPNFVTQIGRDNLDPLARVVHAGPGLPGFADGVWQAILNKLPLASAQLDPQRNLLGEAVHRVNNAGFNLLPISVSQANTYAKDPVIDEIDRLYQRTGWAPGVMTPSAGPNSRLDMRDVRLEDGSSLYDALMRFRQTAQTPDGQSLRGALGDLFNSAEYNDAADGRGDHLTDDAGNENRGAMIAKVFDQVSKQAKADVANSSPTAARYMATAKAMNRNTAATANYTAKDLAGNVPLMRSLGINIEDYEDSVRQ